MYANTPLLKELYAINQLKNVYCKLAPSDIHGVGVFAIKTIPKGTNPFRGSYMAQDSVVVDRSKIDPKVLPQLDNYHPNSGADTTQVVPMYPNQPMWTNYINYSDTPNIELMANGEWVTLVQINQGDELLEDPKRFFNADGSRRVFSVRPGQYPMLS